MGWQGAIWHYDGNRWSEEQSGTKPILSNVCCCPDGEVYACGRFGTLLRRRSGSWEAVGHSGPEADLFGLAWFEGSLYVASLLGVFRLADSDKLDLQIMGEESPATSACHLSAADGVLMSVGAKDVMLFDGKTWTRIE